MEINIFHFNLPAAVRAQGVLNSADTMIDGVAQEMPLIDITYKVINDAGYDTMWLVGNGNIPEITTYISGTTGMDRVPIFQDKHLHIKGGAFISGSLNPEGFQNYPTSSSYGRSTPLTAAGSGIEVKFEDPNTGGITSVLQVAQDPAGTPSNINPGIVQGGLFTTDLPMQAGTKPYNFTMKMPGHLSYYGTLAVNSAGQYGYAAGGNYAIPSAIMLAGDVNGDDVIDMRDIQAESAAYNAYVATPSVYTRAADFNFDGTIDYADFEYIVKNFGKYNTTAPNATALVETIVTTTSEAIEITGFTTIPSGSDLKAFNSVVKPVPYIKTNDSNAFVHYGKVNPFQLFSVAYKDPVLSTGATTLAQIDDAAWRTALNGVGGQILIDGVDRKAATNIYNGATTNSIVERIVSNKGQYEFDPTLFQTAGVHTIVFKAPGYMDRSMKFRMVNGVGNTLSLLAPNNTNTVGKALTLSRSDGTGSTAAHYRDMWVPNMKSITVTDPNNKVVATYTGAELSALFNQVTPANATTFNFTIPAGVFSTPSLRDASGAFSDWKITIIADNYDTYTHSQRINAFAAPTLTAEANRYFNDSNTNPITIGVVGANDKQEWRDAITALQVGGTTIAKADFATKGITLGVPGTPITIDKSLITAPGNIKISVIAQNYQTASIDQPFYKQGITLNKPAVTIYAGQELVTTFATGTAASEWIAAVKSGGNIKFGGTAIKTRVVIDETAGTLTIPADLVRTNGGTSASKSLTVSATGYADTNVNVTVTALTAPALTLSAPAGAPQYGDTITYTIDGADNALWRSSLLLAPTSDQVLDNGDVSIQNTSVKPFVTTSVTNGKGTVTIDGSATQSNSAAGNKNVKFVSPYFAPITIAQPFVQRSAPTPAMTPSGVDKSVIITIPNNAENIRWANAAKTVSGDILVGGVSVKANTTVSSDADNITITLPGTAFPATGDIAITFKAYCYPDTTVTQVVKKNPPMFASKIAYIQESTPIEINYTSDAAWLTSAPVVSVNGTEVDIRKYTLSATELTFVDRSLFNVLGNYKVTISANEYINATFDIFISDTLAHLIKAKADSNGSINPSGWVSVEHGKDQTFTIAPNIGYEIATLKIDDVDATVTNNTYTITNVTDNHTIDVTFKPIVYKITATADSNGAINPSGSVSVNHGTDNTFTITPNIGYELGTLKVDGLETTAFNNTYTFTNVTSDHTIDVTFKPIVHTITATAGVHGTISPSGSVPVNHGKNQTYTITPDNGYEIETVMVDDVEVTVTNTSYTFTNIAENHTIQVTFRPIPPIPGPTVHTITATAGSNGTISPSGSVNVVNGSTQTFTITPNYGYVIATVKVDGVEVTFTNNIYTFTNISGNHSIEVTFKPIVHKISVIAGEHGTISPRNSVSVNHGADQTFTITPNNGYAIAIAKVDGVEVTITNNSYTFTNVTGNHTFEVTFKDVTPPLAPVVNVVKDYDKKVNGRAEAGSIVIAMIGSKVIGSSIAEKDGCFTVVIPRQKAGIILKVVAKDVAGNTSKASNVTVIDKTPPAKPIVNHVNSTSIRVTGKAEAGATVILKVGNKVMGIATASKDKMFSVKIAKQKAGAVLTVIVKDKAGNYSIAVMVTVKK
jgi:hypothetical protein